MLYLIRVELSKYSIYKVGYTSDVQKRYEQYVSYALYPELIATRDGEKYKENIIHRYLHTFTGGYWNFEKDEWYVCAPYDESIIPCFNEDYDVMKKRIWEFRDTVLSPTSSYDQALWAELNGGALISSTVKVGDNLVPNKFWKIDKAFLSVSTTANLSSNPIDPNTKLRQLINKIESSPRIDYRFRSYCEVREDIKNDQELTADLIKYYPDSPEYENLYSYFGFDKCRSVGFQLSDLRKIVYDNTLAGDLKARILSTFKLNQKYLLSEAKETLRTIYQEIGLLSKHPKASDLEEYFNAKIVFMTNKSIGKRSKAYLLISIK